MMILRFFFSMAFLLTFCMKVFAQISFNDARISEWAASCTLQRGFMDIAQPSLGQVNFGTDTNAIGQPTTSLEVVSLGDGGSAVLTFTTAVKNLAGPDFAVFENGFNEFEGSLAYLEFAFVEVSSDGINYVRFPPTYSGQVTQQYSNADYIDGSLYKNLAGRDIWGFGTGFDLEELKDSPSLNVNAITHVRIVDVVGSINPQLGSVDQFGTLINDPYPTPFPSGGFDLAGVAVLNNVTTSIRHQKTKYSFAVYPSPAANLIKIKGLQHNNIYYQIVNLLGKIVKTGKISKDGNIDVSRLSAGVYTLVVEKQDAKEYLKFEKL